MFRIAVVEDDAETRELLCSFLKQYAATHAYEIQTAEFCDGGEILKSYRPVYDIIFLDIEMPKVNGMETAERIRQLDDEVVLVFITNLVQYAIRGYSVGALDYVLKPVNYYTFTSKLDKAVEMVERRAPGQLMLRQADGVVRLDTRHIYYVEVQRGVLRYVTKQGEFFLRGTLQKAEEELEKYHFVRCSNWCLVNLRHVSKIQKDMLEVAGNSLPISRRNKNAFMAALMEYVGGGL